MLEDGRPRGLDSGANSSGKSDSKSSLVSTTAEDYPCSARYPSQTFDSAVFRVRCLLAMNEDSLYQGIRFRSLSWAADMAFQSLKRTSEERFESPP